MKEKYKRHYEIIGGNVKRLRVAKKLTQLQLAIKCSVNREQISRIENARRDYMHSTLLEVCDALEIDIIEVMRPYEGG